MRVGIIRTDLGPGIYLADVESRVQRNFSSQAPGQSRTFRRPRDTELAAVLRLLGLLSVRGTDVAASVDTSANKTLRIRAGGNYFVIVVTSGVATAKTTIAADLNNAFLANSLPFFASVVGTNQLQIDTVSPNAGPGAVLQIDSVANGSTLNTAVGYAVGGVSLAGLTVAALKTAVYPTPTTIDVSSATIVALSTFSLLTALQKTNLVAAIADLVAPTLIETGATLLSFVSGNLSKMRSALYRPDGARVGLPTGAAVAVVQTDGVSVFSFP